MGAYQRKVAFLLILPVRIVPAKFSLTNRSDPGQVRFSSIGEHETKAYTTQQEIIEVDNAFGMDGPAQFCPEHLCSRDRFQFTWLRQRDHIGCESAIPASESSPRCFSYILESRLVDIDCVEDWDIGARLQDVWLPGSYRFEGIQGHQVKRRQLSPGYCHEALLLPHGMVAALSG